MNSPSRSDLCPLCDSRTPDDRVFCAACVIESKEYEAIWR
jgi:hypothetical protein